MSSSLLETLQQSLGRDYAIERELGGGGMARVFVAEERALGRKVVIKVLPPDAASGVSVDRFKREVQLAARLQHPHIVPLLAAGEIDGILYYTMPFIEGESLRARIAREHELPIASAVRILRDVTDALAYAHAHEVVHRDIKPDNILLTGQHAVVADFGIAKALASARLPEGDRAGGPTITQLGVALGTPAYMSPEQASADPQVDHRADIYAIGAVGYELLSGRPPFAGHSPQSLLAAVISQQPEPLEKVRPSVPRPLVSLISRCLEKRAADRPQTAAEVLRDLEAQQTPASPIATPPARVRTGRLWWGVAAASVIAAVAVVSWYLRRAPVTGRASSIAVMPFVPASFDTALARLGRDLVVTLSANIDGVGQIRAADPFATLGLTAGSDRVTSATQAAALARRLGASSYVLGTLVRESRMVRLDFALYPAQGAGEPLGRASVAAMPDSISALTDSATWALLRQIWNRDQPPAPSVAAITTKSMPALRAYLEGERARADGDYPGAVAAFDRAIRADSTFWLAYRRNASTRAWTFMPQDTVLRRWRQHVDELPERDRLLVAAENERSISARIEAHRRLGERYPDYWAAWAAAGDAAFHEGPLVGITHEESRAYLERVVALSPRWTEAWQHLLYIAGVQHGMGSPQADSILRVLDRLRYDSTSKVSHGFGELSLWRLVTAAMRDSSAIHSRQADTTIRQLIQHRLSPVLADIFPAFALFAPEGAATQILLARRVIAAGASPLDQDRYRAAMEWAWASRGAFDSALVGADERARRTGTTQARLDAFRIAAVAQWTGASPDAAQSRSDDILKAAGTMPVNSRAEVVWVQGVLAAARRDSTSVTASVAALESMMRGDSSLVVRDFSRSLRAFQLQARGHTAAAVDSLVALERERGERGAGGFAYGFSRLSLSRWLQSLGRNEEAARQLRWQDGAVVSRSFFAAKFLTFPWNSLELGRLAEARGDVVEARQMYAAFLKRFDMPMPAHRPLLDEARSALTRLSKKGG